VGVRVDNFLDRVSQQEGERCFWPHGQLPACVCEQPRHCSLGLLYDIPACAKSTIHCCGECRGPQTGDGCELRETVRIRHSLVLLAPPDKPVNRAADV
jgi:hypothetical protein